MQLVAQYRDRADQPAAAFELHLQRLYPLLEVLGKFDPTLEGWYLKADIELARLHPVFQAQKPALAALAVLRQKYIDRVSDPKSIALWNGKDSKKEGAALTVTLDTGVLPSELDLTMGERSPADSRLGLYETVAEIVSAAALIYDPAYVTFGPRRYFSKQVFDSRPGASWLLYLPRTLSVDRKRSIKHAPCEKR